jgi:hypothetical protein
VPGELGVERRALDAVVRELPIVVLPDPARAGVRRPAERD